METKMMLRGAVNEEDDRRGRGGHFDKKPLFIYIY